jgi:hypothetical protein
LLRNWTELLPLFVVRLLAQRCESIRVNGLVVRVPRPGVMIQTDEAAKAAPNVVFGKEGKFA